MHGDRCLFSHNVYESWLHPSRFRTGMCAFGPKCSRTVCFFAHSAAELRPRDDFVESIAKEISEKDSRSPNGLDHATMELARARLANRTMLPHGGESGAAAPAGLGNAC